MTRIRISISLAIAALVLSQTPISVSAQGKGGGKGHGGGVGGGAEHVQVQGKGPDKARAETHGRGEEMRVIQPRGRSEIVRGRGNARAEDVRSARAAIRGPERIERSSGLRTNMSERSRFNRVVSFNQSPPWVRTLAASNRRNDVVLAGVLAQAFARGRGDELRFIPAGDQVRLTNRRGEVLAFLDDETARNLGSWRVGVLDEGVRAGAPSFCRSGVGHPVWGRQWCIDKGFGLGTFNGLRWGRTTDVTNIGFGSGLLTNRLGQSALLSLLGPTVFDRLALHAVTLGLVEPLTGMWVSQPTGPRLLRVNSGPQPVAELVDTNRDNLADLMLVALRPW
jgi:hypothetical protein